MAVENKTIIKTTHADGTVTEQEAIVYINAGGRLACQLHIGAYASQEAYDRKPRIITPLDDWVIVDEAIADELHRFDIPIDEPLCETCRHQWSLYPFGGES